MGMARPGRWWELKRHQEVLAMVRRRCGDAAADQTAEELGRYLGVIGVIQKKLEQMTEVLKTAAKQKQQQQQKAGEEPHRNAECKGKVQEKTGALRIKGIGHLSSELLDREIWDWKRFGNRRQVASYTGLCPGEDSSGDTQMSLSIDKHGNPRVRAVLVEIAWLLPRYQPTYKPLQRWKWLFDPDARASAAMRKKAAVALARRLAVDLWRIRT